MCMLTQYVLFITQSNAYLKTIFYSLPYSYVITYVKVPNSLFMFLDTHTV